MYLTTLIYTVTKFYTSHTHWTMCVCNMCTLNMSDCSINRGISITGSVIGDIWHNMSVWDFLGGKVLHWGIATCVQFPSSSLQIDLLPNWRRLYDRYMIVIQYIMYPILYQQTSFILIFENYSLENIISYWTNKKLLISTHIF